MKLADWDAEKRALEPRKAEFEAAFMAQTTPIIEPSLTCDQLSAIRERLEAAGLVFSIHHLKTARKKLFTAVCVKPCGRRRWTLWRPSISGSARFTTYLMISTPCSNELTSLVEKFQRLEGIDRDGTLATLKTRLNDILSQVDALAERIRTDNRKFDTLQSQVQSQTAEYHREKNKGLDKSSPVRATIDRSERVRRVIDELVPALFPLKVRELATAMTTVYKQLAHKDQVNKITILDDGTTQIRGKTGKEITFERSAGENQILATALIAGLAKVFRGESADGSGYALGPVGQQTSGEHPHVFNRGQEPASHPAITRRGNRLPFLQVHSRQCR